MKLKLTIRNTNFIVEVYDEIIYDIIDIAKRYLLTHSLTYDHRLKRNVKKPKDLYMLSFDKQGVYVFNINNLKDIISLLKRHGISKEDIEIHFEKDYDIKKINLTTDPKFILRPYQRTYVDIIKTSKHVYNFIDLPTGMGKSAIASFAVVELNCKTMIIVLPRYMVKWKEDLHKYTDIKDSEIYFINGSTRFKKYMELNIEGIDDHKVVIVSTRTLHNYFKEYNEYFTNDDVFTYPIEPFDLMEMLKIGTILNDETHQEFHLVYRAMLYFNVKRFIGSSATLDSNDSDMRKMYNYMFPTETRVTNIVEAPKYIDVTAVGYHIDNLRGIQWKRNFGYNHILFEQTLIKKPKLLKSYLEMLDYYIKSVFIDNRTKKDKALVFAATVDMCSIMTSYFRKQYNDLDVNRYVEDDSLDNLHNSDIVFSTVISSGTAHDIENLKSVFQTISIGSLQANKQARGRLRYRDDTDLDYYYFYCKDISKQVALHKTRYNVLRSTSKSYRFIDHPKTLRSN